MKSLSRVSPLHPLFLVAAALAAGACRSTPPRADDPAAAQRQPEEVESGVEPSPEATADARAAGPETQPTQPAAQAGQKGPLTPEDIVLAVVNERPLTLASAIKSFLSSHMGHGVLVRGEPAVRELAGRLVERDLFLEEAASLGLPDDPLVVEIVTSYRKDLAADEYWKREVTEKVVVSVEEVESFYSKTDIALKLTLIESADRARAEALRARVEQGENMGDLARKESIHPSRTFDGALSFVRRGEIERSLEEEAFALEQPGSLTPVVATEKGFAFARLEERSVNPDRPPRETAIPQIKGILEERLSKRLSKEVGERVEAAAKVWIDENGLSSASVLDGPDETLLVARSGSDSLTLKDVRDGLKLDALRAAPPETAGEAALSIVRQWARREALKQAAVDAGLLDDPMIADKADSFRSDVLMKVLCTRYVYKDLEPSEAELQAFYEEHKATDYTKPAEVRLAHMLLATEEEANAALARVKAGEAFENVAREVSKDVTSAQHGGRIGWIKPGQLLPAVEERAFALEVGALGGPIATEAGYFVLKVIDRNTEQVIPYAYARQAALKRLTTERERAAYAKWALALRDRASVRLDEAGVAAAVAYCEAQALATEAAKAKPDAPLEPSPLGIGPTPTEGPAQEGKP